MIANYVRFPTENSVTEKLISDIDPIQLCTHCLSLSIPFTTGEFGVVYKAQYTEPEGDIGYKTSTVAIKTLKGKDHWCFSGQFLMVVDLCGHVIYDVVIIYM